MYFLAFAVDIVLGAPLSSLSADYLEGPPPQHHSQQNRQQHHNQNKDAALLHGSAGPDCPKGILKHDEGEEQEGAET